MRTCESCHYGQSDTKENIERCFGGVCCFKDYSHPHWSPFTNADRIRHSADFKLAQFLAAASGGPVGLWLDWLKKESET